MTAAEDRRPGPGQEGCGLTGLARRRCSPGDGPGGRSAPITRLVSRPRVAAVSGAPIFQTFVVREKLGHYRFFSFPAKFIPREILRAGPEAVSPHVAEYAARLADVAKQYPFQWFNIYPFWDETPAIEKMKTQPIPCK